MAARSSAEGAIFAASVDDSNGLRVGKPRKLFEGLGRLIGIAPDGRFLFLDRPPSPEQPRGSELRVVFNWTEELKQLVPTR